jgi:hypothetical protein
VTSITPMWGRQAGEQRASVRSGTVSPRAVQKLMELVHRRTGITLKEGKRDEHGMEEIEGMFSSPEKSPAKLNGFNAANETILSSEGMSMDEGVTLS